jgi:hypothetical protein
MTTKTQNQAKYQQYNLENAHLYKHSQYHRLASIPAHYVVDSLKNNDLLFELNTMSPDQGGLTPQIPVGIGCARLKTYTTGLTCVHCGCRGHFFGVERQYGAKRWHLNLYHLSSSGQELLMTSDHIAPQSKGGANGVNNRQTMCTICNGLKSNYDSIDEALEAKRVRDRGTQSIEQITKHLSKAITSIDYATLQSLIDPNPKWNLVIKKQTTMREKYLKQIGFNGAPGN